MLFVREQTTYAGGKVSTRFPPSVQPCGHLLDNAIATRVENISVGVQEVKTFKVHGSDKPMQVYVI